MPLFRTRIRALAQFAVGLGLVSIVHTSLHAQPVREVRNLSLSAHTVATDPPTRSGSDGYATGFEQPEFQSGFSLVGQGGW